MSSPRIVFHHVPKCGGMSIARGLVLTYYPFRFLLKGKAGFPGGLNVAATETVEKLFPTDQFLLRREILAYQLAKGTSPLVFGHYPFSPRVRDRFGDSWAFITLLRNPVDRWYSEYFYDRFKKKGVGKTDMGLEKFLESNDGRGYARSFVNYLTEAPDPIAKASEKEANLALEALSCFDAVGCLERLEQFRTLMGRRFGRRPFFPHVNRSPADRHERRRPDPDSNFHKRLIDLLAADIYIFEKTQARIDAA